MFSIISSTGTHRYYTAHLRYNLPYHDDNLYGLQRDKSSHPAHDALVSAPQSPRNQVKDKSNDEEKDRKGQDDCQGDTSGSIVEALVASESEAWGVIFTADGTICTNI